MLHHLVNFKLEEYAKLKYRANSVETERKILD